MSYVFACEFCSGSVFVESLEPGSPVPCPKCGKVVKVPIPKTAQELRPYLNAPARRPWGSFRRLEPILILLGILYLVGGIPVAILVMSENPLVGLYGLFTTILFALICFGIANGVELLLTMKQDLEELRQRGVGPRTGSDPTRQP